MATKRQATTEIDAREGRNQSLRAAVSGRLGESRFGLWFGDGVSLELTGAGDRLEIGVPNAFFRDWIRGHFAESLLEAGRDVTGKIPDLHFRLDNEAPPKLGQVVDTPPLEIPRTPTPLPQASPSEPKRPEGRRGKAKAEESIDLAPRLVVEPRTRIETAPTRSPRRLEDFVTGPNNRLAHASALEMVRTLGASFSPLVIHGGVGLGKTHLLEAIEHAWRSKRSNMKVLRVTAESFTNGFLDALRQGSLNAFRGRHRNVDALLVDDVHFIASKKATQDEFQHTFDTLVAKGVPVILACDKHPRQVARLSDELATRFLGGMVVKIDSPDAATRKAILKSKAQARGVDVPESVLSYIAENLKASVRELEGALHAVVAHASLLGKRLDLGLAKSALRDTIRHTSRALGLKDVEKAVCLLFGVEPDLLKSDSRTKLVTYPRMLAMYLSRKHVGAAYSEIGRHYGGRNHSTVISAQKKVISWLEDEERIHRLDGFETTGEILAALEGSLGA